MEGYKRYNIRGKRIDIAECMKCGHQVDVSNIYFAEVNGIAIKGGYFNVLVVLDRISECCTEPDYQHICSE